MMQFAIQEPKIEQFFNHSKDEIMRALKFIVDNNIKDFEKNYNSLELSSEQKKELNSRISSFHNNPSMGISWSELKNNISR
jgi:putative addiction module component (TIGR02574 family)